MTIFHFGEKKIPFRIEPVLLRCPVCKVHTTYDMLVSVHYFHYIGVPLLPYRKTADLKCTRCGHHAEELPFNKTLPISNYEEIKQHFKTPWYMYWFPATLALLLLVYLLKK